MSGTICSPCSNNCLSCANASTNCTSCNATEGLFLDTVLMKCVANCNDGFYKNSLVQSCLPCSEPCLFCSESATKCTYCPVGRYLLNFNCLTNCSSTKLFIENSLARTCDPCNANCLTCENTTTTCVTCNKTALLFL